MASLLKIGLMFVMITIVLFVHDTEADEEVKRKRVIIKIPHRVKHIYHHHTKKVHVHKTKPKPLPKKPKPHKHVHVVVEEEELVQPIKSWKTSQPSYKGNSGWDEWKSSSNGYKHSVKHPDDFSESSHYDDDFDLEEDHEPRESKTYGRGPSYKAGIGGPRGKNKGGRFSNSFKSYEDSSYEGSYEVHHKHDHEVEYDRPPRRKPGNKKVAQGGPKSMGRGTPRPTYMKPTKRPRYETKYSEAADEYDELYDRGPSAYPERQEHPSWRERSLGDSPAQSSPPEPHSWSLRPQVPAVNEFIDDVHDTAEPVITYGNSGGFYPSSYTPITTITSSVVQKSPSTPRPQAIYSAASGNQDDEQFVPKTPSWERPRSPIISHGEPISTLQNKPKKNPGYMSQVSQNPEGQTVGYKSHVGHNTGSQSSSSSFQSVSYGGHHN